ncbi:MAG: hypothetical protein ACXACY_10285 [Candidatus Hodarchaeales archaeon]|jgi:hypothetical protein
MKLEDIKDEIMDKLVAIKDFVFIWKQGEALERSSFPEKQGEALSLGNFGSPTNVALNMLITLDELYNQLCSTEDEYQFVLDENDEYVVDEYGELQKVLVKAGEKVEDQTLSRLAANVARASASSGGLRLTKTLETIQGITPAPIFPSPGGSMRGNPEYLKNIDENSDESNNNDQNKGL